MLYYRSYGSPNSRQAFVFLHGFLGSSLDFLPIVEELQHSFFCLTIDLPSHGHSPAYPRELLSITAKTILALSLPSFLLVGYSLGGRISMQLANRLKPQKLIILSAHTGLITQEERKQRKQQDDLWQERLRVLSPQEFLSLWYAQAPFQSLHKKQALLHDLYLKRHYTNPHELADLLQEASLSKMPPCLPSSHPIYFLYGEEDLPYRRLYEQNYQRKQVPFPPRAIPNAGHTLLLENPQDCAKQIKDIALGY
ncbi:MAG: alpha/beta fold hydrolase [Chlamydiae bacterium]|nr:alpha/beta fold hydrolase [Chlamydiota bacterium]